MKINGSIVAACLVILLAISFFSCKRPGIGREEITKNDFVIVTIDSVTNIMASDLFDRLFKSNLLLDGGYLDSTTYFDSLFVIVIDSLISIKALDVDLSKDRGAYRTFKGRFRNFYIDYLYRNIIIDSIKVDSLEIDSFYHAHSEQFIRKEQVHARHLVISTVGLRHGKDSVYYSDFTDEQLDSIAMAKTNEYHNMSKSGVDFGELAYNYSMHRSSGNNHGDLGYFPRNTFAKEFEEVVFNLDSGIISEPFRTPDGWHIVEIINHVDSGLMEFTNDVYSRINNSITSGRGGRRSKAFLDSLFAASSFVFNDSALNMNLIDVPETTWAVIANDLDTITFYRMAETFADFRKAKRLNSLTLEDKHNALISMCRFVVIIRAGDNLGFGNDPEVVSKRKELYHSHAVNVFRKAGVEPNYIPPDSDIEAYYEKYIDKFVFDKPVYVQHIIVEDSIFGEFLRDQALSGIDFLDLAKQYYPGMEDIRIAAADLGWIGSEEMPKAFYIAAIGTSKMNISHPVKTEWGYHIIKVIDRRYSRELSEVRGRIVVELKAQHKAEIERKWHNELMVGHEIRYNLDQLKRIELQPKKERR